MRARLSQSAGQRNNQPEYQPRSARSIFANGTQRKGKLIVDLPSPAVGQWQFTVDLVVSETRCEAHHVEFECVLDPGGLLVILPSCGAASAHVFPNGSLI